MKTVTVLSAAAKPDKAKQMNLPPSSAPPYRRVFAYLTCTRGIPAETVQRLIDAELLYQDAGHGNAIFVNRDRDYCEIRGTLSYGKPFHGCRKTKSDNFWSFGRPSGNHPSAYICEAAIDAISLYEILRTRGRVNAVFCSIGGVANQNAINRIAEQYNAILAVDNDEAGAKCRERNSHLTAVLPVCKDWNQDLIEFVRNGKSNNTLCASPLGKNPAG